MKLLIAGCGYVGTPLAVELAADGHEVWGLRRRFATVPPGVHTIEADLGLPADLAALPPSVEAVVYLASPRGSDDAHYRAAYVDGTLNLLAALAASGDAPRRMLFASSTAVYAQQAGEWVDEDSPTVPQHFAGARLLEAEAGLHASPVPSTVVRFGGIYGPRRTRLVDRVRTGAAAWRPGRYTNRIHLEDCVGVLRHLLTLPEPEPVYLAVDDEPAEERTVYTWLAGATGAPTPRRAAPAAAPPARGNKRCRNTRLRASGYAFRYPTFRDGYAAVLAG